MGRAAGEILEHHPGFAEAEHHVRLSPAAWRALLPDVTASATFRREQWTN